MGIATLAVAGIITIGAVYWSSNGGFNNFNEGDGFKSRKLRSVEEEWVEESPLPELTYVIAGEDYPVDGGSILKYSWVLAYKVEPEHTAINLSFEVELPFSTFDQESLNVTLYSYALGILPPELNETNDREDVKDLKILRLYHDPVFEKLYLDVDISEPMWVNLTEPWRQPDCWWLPLFPDCYPTIYSDCVFYDHSPDQTWDPDYCYHFPITDCLPYNTTSECYYIDTTACLMDMVNNTERPQDMLCPTDVNETDCIQINDRGLYFTQYDFSVPTKAPTPETYEKDFCGMTMESIWMAEETKYDREYVYDKTIQEEDENGCVRVLMRIKAIITTPPPTYNPFKALRKTEQYFSAKKCINANTTGFYTPPIEPIDWKDFNVSVEFNGEIFNYIDIKQVLISTVNASISQTTKPEENQTSQASAVQEIKIKKPSTGFNFKQSFSERGFILKHEQMRLEAVLRHPETLNHGVVITVNVPQLEGVYMAKFENITPWWSFSENIIATSMYEMFNSTYNVNGDEITINSVIEKLADFHAGKSRQPDITYEWVVEKDSNGEDIIVQGIFTITPFIAVCNYKNYVQGKISIWFYSRILTMVSPDDELKYTIKADFSFPPGSRSFYFSGRKIVTVTAQPFVPLIPPLNATQEPDTGDDIIFQFKLSHVLDFSIRDIWMNVTCPDLVIIPSTLEIEIIHEVNITSDSNTDIMMTTNHTYHIHFTELAPQVLIEGQQAFRLVNNGIPPHYSIICQVKLSFRKEDNELVVPYVAGVSKALLTPGIDYVLYARDLIGDEKVLSTTTATLTTVATPSVNATTGVPVEEDVVVEEEVIEEEAKPLMYLMTVGSNSTFIVNLTMSELTSEIDIEISMPETVLAIYYSRIIFVGNNIINLEMVELDEGEEDIGSWDMQTRTNLKQKFGNVSNIADNFRNESDNIVLEFNIVLLDEKEKVVKDTEHELTTTVTYTNGEDLVQKQSIAVLEPDIQLFLRVANETTDADPGEIFQYYVKVNHTEASQSPAHHINVSILLPYMVVYKHFLPYEYSRVPVRDQLPDQGDLGNDEILQLYLYKLDLNEAIEGTFLIQITTKLMEGICLQAQVEYGMSSFYRWGRRYPYTTVSENVLNIRNATLKFIGTSLPDTPDKLIAIHEQVTYRLTIPLPPISSNLTMELFLPRRNVTRKIWEVQSIQKTIPEVLPIEETFFDNGCYTEMRPCFCYGQGNRSFDASWLVSHLSCTLKADQLCTNTTDIDTGKSQITNCDYSPEVYRKCRNISKEMCLQNPNVTSYLQTPSTPQSMACNMSNSSHRVNANISLNDVSGLNQSTFMNSSNFWNSSSFNNCSNNIPRQTEEEKCHEFSISFCQSSLFTECSWAGAPEPERNHSEILNDMSAHNLDDYIGNWTCACLKETEQNISVDVEDPFEGLNLTAILEGHYNSSQKPYQICSSLFANKSLLKKPGVDEPPSGQNSHNASVLLNAPSSNQTSDDDDFYTIPDFCFEETIVELGMASVVHTSISTTRIDVICTFVGGNNHNPFQPVVKYKAVNLAGYGLGGDSVSVYVTMVISDEVENVRDETLVFNTSSTFMYMSVPIPPASWYEENCTCSKPLNQYFHAEYPLDCSCESMTLIGHPSERCNCTTTFLEIEDTYISAPSCDCVNFCENNVQYFFNQPMVKDFTKFDNTTCDCETYKTFMMEDGNADYISKCRGMYFRNYTCQNVNHTIRIMKEECRNISKIECWKVNKLQEVNATWLCQCSVDSNCSCVLKEFLLPANVANYSIIQCLKYSWANTSGYHGDVSSCDCQSGTDINATDVNHKQCYCHDKCTVNITDSCLTVNSTFCEDVTRLKEYIVNDENCVCEKYYGLNRTIAEALKLYKQQRNTIKKNKTSNGMQTTCGIINGTLNNGTINNGTMHNGTVINGRSYNVTAFNNTNFGVNGSTVDDPNCDHVLHEDPLSLDDFILHCNCSDLDVIIPVAKPDLCQEIVPKEVFDCECYVPPDNETQRILDNWDYNLTIIDEAVTYCSDEFVLIEPELEISFVRIEPDPVDIVDSLDFVKFSYKIQHTDSSNSPAYNLTLYLDAVNFTISNGSGEILPTDILSSASCLNPTLCEISYDNEIGLFHLGFLPVDVEGASLEGTFSLALRDDVDFVANSIITGRGILWYDSCVVDFPGRLYGPINSSDICHIYAPNVTANLEFTTAYAYMYQNDEYDSLPNTFSIGDFIDIRAYLWVPEITLNVVNYSITGDDIFAFTPAMAMMLLTDSIYVRNDTTTLFLDRRQNPFDNEDHILYPDEKYDTAEFTDKGFVFVPGVIVNRADNVPNDDDYMLLKYMLTLKDDPGWKQDMLVPFTVSVIYYSDYDRQLLTLIDKSVELKVVEPRLNLRVEILDHDWQILQIQNTTGYTCEENACCTAGEECESGRVCVTNMHDIENCDSLQCLCYSGFSLNDESTCTAVGRTAGDILVFGVTVFHSPEYTGNAFDLYITLHSDLKSDLLPNADTMSHISADGYLGNVRKPQLTQISDNEFQIYIHRFDHVVNCERFTVPYRIKPSLHIFAGQTWKAQATMNYRSSKPYDTPFNIKSRYYEMNDTVVFPLFAPAPSVRFKMLQPSGESSPIDFEVFSSSDPMNEVTVNIRNEQRIVFQLEVIVPKIKCSITLKFDLPEGNGIVLENVTMVSMGTEIDFPNTNFDEPQVTENIDGGKFFFAYFPNIHSKANTLTKPRSLDSTKQQMFKTMKGEQQPYPTVPECIALNSSLYEQRILLGCYYSKIAYFGAVVTDMHPALPNYNLSQVMTRELCLNICSDRGYMYAGLMKGAHCLCGTEEQFLQYYENGRTFEFNGTEHAVSLEQCDTYCTGENKTCGSAEFALIYGPVPGGIPQQQCNWYSGLYDENEDVFTLEFALSVDALATKSLEEYLQMQVTYDHGENHTITLLPLAPYKIEAGIVELLMNVWVSPKMNGYLPGDYLEYYTEIHHAAHSTVTARDVYILWMLPSYMEYVNVTNHPSIPEQYRYIESVENVETDPRIGIKFYVKTLFHDDVISFHFLVRLDPLNTLPQGEYHLMSMSQVYYNSWGLYNHFEEDYTFDVVPHAHAIVPIKVTFEVPSKYMGRVELDDIKLSTYNILYDEINNILYACFFNNTIHVYEGGCFITGDLPAYYTESPHTCEEYCNCTYIDGQQTFNNCSDYEPRPTNCSCGCLPDCIQEMMSCEIDCVNRTDADLSSCLEYCKLSETNCTQSCCLDSCVGGLDLCLVSNCIECKSAENCSVELECAEQCIKVNDICSNDCVKSPVTCQENCSMVAWNCMAECDRKTCVDIGTVNCTAVCYSQCLSVENQCDINCCYKECNLNVTVCDHQCTETCGMDNTCLEMCYSNCNVTLYTCNETCEELRLVTDGFDCEENCYQNCSVTECTVIIETDCIEEDIYDNIANILEQYSLTDLRRNGRSFIVLQEASLSLMSVNCSENICTTVFQVSNTSSNCSATGTESCHTSLDSSCVFNCAALCEGTSSCIDEHRNCLEDCDSVHNSTDVSSCQSEIVISRNASFDICLISALNCFLRMSNCYLSCNSCADCDNVYCASNYTQCMSTVTDGTIQNGTSSMGNVSLNLTSDNPCLSECNRNLTMCHQVCRQHSNISYICHSLCLQGHYECALQCLTFMTRQSFCIISTGTNDTYNQNETNNHDNYCKRQCDNDLEICRNLFLHMMNQTVSNTSRGQQLSAVNCSMYTECVDSCSNLCNNRTSCRSSCLGQCVQDATNYICNSEVNCTVLSLCVQHSRKRRDASVSSMIYGASYIDSGKTIFGRLDQNHFVESRKRRDAFLNKLDPINSALLNFSGIDLDIANKLEPDRDIDIWKHIHRIKRSLEDNQENVTHLNITVDDAQSTCNIRHQYLNYLMCLDNCAMSFIDSVHDCATNISRNNFSCNGSSARNSSSDCDSCYQLQPSSHKNCYRLCQETDSFCSANCRNCSYINCTESCNEVCDRSHSECLTLCDTATLKECNWCDSLSCQNDSTCFCDQECLNVTFFAGNHSECIGGAAQFLSQEMCTYNCECKQPEYVFHHWRGLNSNVGNILGLLTEPYTLYGLSHDGRAIMHSFDYGATWSAILKSLWNEAKDKELYIAANNLNDEEILTLKPRDELVYQSQFGNNTFGVSGVGVHFLQTVYEWKVAGTWHCCKP